MHQYIRKDFSNQLRAQQNNIDQGQLQVTVLTANGSRPVENARVRITYTGNPENVLEELVTDSSGKTPVIELNAPPLEYSVEPSEPQPYSEYNIQVIAEGYEDEEVAGTEVLPTVLAQQPIEMKEKQGAGDDQFGRIVIAPHTLFAEYSPKIEEDEIKPMDESGEIVLSRVVVPEYVVVHDGVPSDNTAPDYYVRYKDYIKNVASSEIYATWNGEAIRANILAIMSFTLNRVYTEWYGNQRSFVVQEI